MDYSFSKRYLRFLVNYYYYPLVGLHRVCSCCRWLWHLLVVGLRYAYTQHSPSTTCGNILACCYTVCFIFFCPLHEMLLVSRHIEILKLWAATTLSPELVGVMHKFYLKKNHNPWALYVINIFQFIFDSSFPGARVWSKDLRENITFMSANLNEYI